MTPPPCTLGDIAAAIVGTTLITAAAALFCWLTAPAVAPAAQARSYCFRADPPPCAMTVEP